MDFAWLSDPLLVYALVLSALLFCGISILMFTIVIKHRERLKSQNIQNLFTSLINQAKRNFESGKKIQSEILHINQLIDLHNKDVIYGWVRLLEKIPKEKRQEYLAIAAQTKILDCIVYCLNQEGLAEKCAALEAVGLSNFQNYANEAKKYIETEIVAPYACIALSRLIGQKALPQILESYTKGFLTTTQTLAAIVEIPHHQITNLKKESFPIELAHYLEFN